jgi:uncharacterized protein YeaC (DUF1315 family)
MNTMHIDDLLKLMTPELYERFQRAIELRKWPDGRVLSQEQLETCMQAVIAYELKHLPPEKRTGYVPAKPDGCETDLSLDDIQPLNWQ